ncbi:hypothetical protein AAG565_14830 [Fontimonas sp. SYSU GA230001]|uniref:hypothetical protein n=1 Tax=Fontimonas sp. SYSU GA230001 TaxID=3142450 RepID=UPI0032B576CE
MSRFHRTVRHALPVAAVLLAACKGGGDGRPAIDEGPPPELRSYDVRGSADKLPLLQAEQIDSRSNDGRFRIDWEIAQANGYEADVYVSDNPYPPLMPYGGADGKIRFASLYCWDESPDCGLKHTLNCRFDPHNVLECEGQGAVDLTQWLGELPRDAWIVFTACNRQDGGRSCAGSAVEVEFR